MIEWAEIAGKGYFPSSEMEALLSSVERDDGTDL